MTEFPAEAARDKAGVYCTCGLQVVEGISKLAALDEFAMETGDCKKCNRRYELFVYRFDEVVDYEEEF